MPVRDGSAPLSSLPPAPEPPTALDRLRAATRSLHDQIEATGTSARILAPSVEPPDYRDFLVRTLAVVCPVERWLSAPAQGSIMPDPSACSRTPALVEDIRALGGGTPPTEVVALTDAVVATMPMGRGAILGALYVLEGSALGGAMIAKHLRRRFGPGAVAFTRFHGGEGVKAGERWTHLRRLLDGLERDGAEMAAAERTALALFGCFLAAYDTGGRSS